MDTGVVNETKRWCGDALIKNVDDAAREFTDALRAVAEDGTSAAKARLQIAVTAVMRISARVLIELE
jgi:hypothetical protein